MSEISHPVFGRYDPELICECGHPRKYHNHMGLSENLVVGTNCNACQCIEFKVKPAKVVKLEAVIKLLEDEAKEAYKKSFGGIMTDTIHHDNYYYFQGLHNSYLEAAKLLKKKAVQLK